MGPAPFAGLREMQHDNFKMDTGDKVYDISKGTCFIMNTMMVHHTPKWWVKDYDPNNKEHKEMDMKQIHFDFWLDEDGKFRSNPLSFLTFSRDKRDCPGQSLAMIFMKYEVFGPNADDQIEIDIQKSIVVEPKT